MTSSRTRITNGLLLFCVAIIHNLFGVAVGAGVPGTGPPALGGRNLFSEVAAGGFLGAIEPDPWRTVLLWFLWFGLLAMAFGWFLHRVEREGHEIPRAVAWSLGGLALAGGLLVPASGFWLVLPIAGRMWWHGRRFVRRAPPAGEPACG
jgi:hypothetical protein